MRNKSVLTGRRQDKTPIMREKQYRYKGFTPSPLIMVGSSWKAYKVRPYGPMKSASLLRLCFYVGNHRDVFWLGSLSDLP